MNVKPYVSRAGVKLEHALREFEIDVAGQVCADFGCHAGGFTDCLLRHGAARVVALDTGYGVLDYRLRTDPRVEVRERTNVLHCPPPDEPVDLVTIDLGWTRQRLAIPAALGWLAPGGAIISLIKPNYELDDNQKRSMLADGLLDDLHAVEVLRGVLRDLPGLGVEVVGSSPSPIRGAKSARKARRARDPARRPAGEAAGNLEYLVFARKT